MRAKIVIYRSGVERLIDDVNKKDLNEYNHGRLDLLKAMLKRGNKHENRDYFISFRYRKLNGRNEHERN